ncbi:WhiB family transcriptional regulator [Streptomyces avermitilis]|uniref:WhiB family transcriptional regulator n=1 Tax=Streptomyces avermitilis TaxID=33903 RepID=UPI00382BDA14
MPCTTAPPPVRDPRQRHPPQDHRTVRAAQRLCLNCPTRTLRRIVACHRHENGIWVGTTEHDRATSAAHHPKTVTRPGPAATEQTRSSAS